MNLATFPFEKLRRTPDIEAPNLFAADATDRLLLDLAAPAIAEDSPGSVVVVGDRYGGLTLGAAMLGARQIRVHQDSYTSELALASNWERLGAELGLPEDSYGNRDLDASLFDRAQVVLMQLPKDLRQLEHWAHLVSHYADPSVQVFAGGRVKHMTRAMNDVLARFFGSVTASLARQKSRVLIAADPLPFDEGVVADTERECEGGGEPEAGNAAQSRESHLSEHYDPDLDLWVCSTPGSFASGKVDIGTRFLIPFLEDRVNLPEGPEVAELVAVDLGCGTGLLTATLLRAHPDYHVIATDRSAAAAASTRATIRRNGLDKFGGRVEIRRDHGLSQQPDTSVDLVVCNPPFHSEAAITTAASDAMFIEAARVLKPGGVMLTVFNSHLPHRRALERMVGPTVQQGRNAKFTVTRSVRGSLGGGEVGS